MNKCEIFLEYFDNLTKNIEVPEDVKEFYEMLKSSQNNYTEKTVFTETGLAILTFLQTCENSTMKSRDIADAMTLPSRTVSGAMRKLVTDGYVEKFGQNPVIYALTKKGKEINLDEFKGEN